MSFFGVDPEARAGNLDESPQAQLDQDPMPTFASDPMPTFASDPMRSLPSAAARSVSRPLSTSVSRTGSPPRFDLRVPARPAVTMEEILMELQRAQEYWANSAAQAARQLERERQDRAADIDGLKREGVQQQVMLAQIAEQLLGGSFENSIEELRRSVAALQQQQDLQAAALREGLMDIQQQRLAINQIKQSGSATEGDRSQVGVSNGEDGKGSSASVLELAAEVMQLKSVIAGVIEDTKNDVALQVNELESRLMSFRSSGASHDEGSPAVTAAAASAVAAAASADVARLEEILGRQIAELTKEFSDLRATLRGEIRAEFAAAREPVAAIEDKLEKVHANSEQRFVDLVREIELERQAQQAHLQQSDDRVAAMEAMLGAAVQRASQLEDNFGLLSREWEQKFSGQLQSEVAQPSSTQEQFATLTRYMELAEARESELKQEVVACTDICLRCQQEASEAQTLAISVSKNGASGGGLDVEALLSQIAQHADKVVKETMKEMSGDLSDLSDLRSQVSYLVDGFNKHEERLCSTAALREELAAVTKAILDAQGTTESKSRPEAAPLDALSKVPAVSSQSASQARMARSTPSPVPAALHGFVDPAKPLPQAPAAVAHSRRRRALLVGCGYTHTSFARPGCCNDVWNMLSLFRHTLQYAEDQVKMLMENSETCPQPADKQPTRQNLLNGLQWLVKDAQPGDEVCFYFAGHGTQLPQQLVERPLYEACLVPSDFAEDVSSQVRAQLGCVPRTVTSEPMDAYRVVRLAEVADALSSLPSSCKATVVLDCAMGLLPGAVSVESNQACSPAFSRVEICNIGGADVASGRYLELPPVTRMIKPSSAKSLTSGSCPVFVFCAAQPPQSCVELQVEGFAQGALTWSWVKALVACHLKPTAGQQWDTLNAILGKELGVDQQPMLWVTYAAKLDEGLIFKEDSADVSSCRPPMPIQRPLPVNSARRRALIVGTNYTGSHAPLKGCVNDAWHVHCLLRQTMQYDENQIMLLSDTQDHELCRVTAPTKANLQAGLQWLYGNARPGDELLFAFCGYGAQQPQSAMQGATMQEAYLVPSDFAADMPDNFFVERLGGTDSLSSSTSTLYGTQSVASGYSPASHPPVPASAGYRLLPLADLAFAIGALPAGVRATVLLDCSHSLVPNVSPSNPQPLAFAKVSRGTVNYRKLRDFVSRPRFLELPHVPRRETSVRSVRYPECIVHCFSACGNSQWNAEMPIEGTVQGAFTWAFVKALAGEDFHCQLQTLQKRLENITADLKLRFRGVEQTPVLQISRAASVQDFVFGG